MLFWTRCPEHGDSTEPDVVLVSNKWVVVVEVKLGSGFGERQPWREYLVGQHIAQNRGLPRDSVRYLVVTRAIARAGRVFGGLESDQRDVLEQRDTLVSLAGRCGALLTSGEGGTRRENGELPERDPNVEQPAGSTPKAQNAVVLRLYPYPPPARQRSSTANLLSTVVQRVLVQKLRPMRRTAFRCVP